MKRFLLIGAAALTLAGCASGVQKTYYEGGLTYDGTLKLAAIYTHLPACAPPSGPQPCSDPQTVLRIRAAAQAATTAYLAAEGVVTTSTSSAAALSAAQANAAAAIAALAALIPATVKAN